MGNFISKIFKSSILGSIGLIVLGTLLVFQSEATIISISYIIGLSVNYKLAVSKL